MHCQNPHTLPYLVRFGIPQTFIGKTIPLRQPTLFFVWTPPPDPLHAPVCPTQGALGTDASYPTLQCKVCSPMNPSWRHGWHGWFALPEPRSPLGFFPKVLEHNPPKCNDTSVTRWNLSWVMVETPLTPSPILCLRGLI